MPKIRLEAYNSSLEAVIGACRDIFGFLRFSAFISFQEVQDSLHGSLRKLTSLMALLITLTHDLLGLTQVAGLDFLDLLVTDASD